MEKNPPSEPIISLYAAILCVFVLPKHRSARPKKYLLFTIYKHAKWVIISQACFDLYFENNNTGCDACIFKITSFSFRPITRDGIKQYAASAIFRVALSK